MTAKFADEGAAVPLRLVPADGVEAATAVLPPVAAAWAGAHGFAGKAGERLVLPGEDGNPALALIGTGDAASRARTRFAAGAAIAALPKGRYAIEDWPQDRAEAEEIGLGYLFARYRFDTYRKQSEPGAELVAPPDADMAARLARIATSEYLTRRLIDTPAADMGPDALEQAARDLADAYGAGIEVTTGEELLEANLPMIHAVGRAAATPPRLIELTWTGAADGPTLTLVGKGVCFDTGGLNLKPGASMALMKKDMGGAANVLGLARSIMDAGLKVRLRVLIPAVENSVSGSSFRPGDILTARNGMTVEINNTDAEGRLVLADALSLAVETPPDLLVSMATLTGAARVAVGPDIAPFLTDDEALAASLATAGRQVADPVWRLPFHTPYEPMIEPGIADLDNAPKGGMAGAITAALFLRRFTADHPSYLHFDIFAWSQSNAPGRPKGGLGQGGRALLEALPEVLWKT
ncbi:leucyl aminopeptidase family protein [Rhodobacterales bacterium HKCCE3408]|nr:leucyl aminopeptidase family protein [Rhodobacterales bacterium HKCCE3408]